MLRRTSLFLLAAAAAVLAVVGVSSATGRDDDRAAAAVATERPAQRTAVRTAAGDDRRALARDVRRAVLAGAPGAAEPVIAAAVRDGRLSEARAGELRAAVAALRDGERPRPARLRALLLDPAARAVALDAARALAERAPALADPVLDRAVADGTLTERRAERLRERAARFAARLAEPANGAWLAAAAAVVRAAPGIAAPVLDRAVAADRLTREQADAVLDAIRTLDPRRAMGAVALDPDARAVARELAAALADRVPALVDPVLDDAVADGRLTERRADRVRAQVQRQLRRLG
jgi:hypothetical protein